MLDLVPQVKLDLSRVRLFLPDIEAILRSENRIQDDVSHLNKLGYKNILPEIPQHLIFESAITNGTIVLQFPSTMLEYQRKLNLAIDNGKPNFFLLHDAAREIKISEQKAKWLNIPNTISKDTLKLSEAEALVTSGGKAHHPMHTIFMLGYHLLATGQQIPGFRDKWTFTNHSHTLVGSHTKGIMVHIYGDCAGRGNEHVGLARPVDPII